MAKFINDVWSKVKTHLIYILIICLLAGALCISINKCSNTSGEYKHNIEALKDTIKYYQDKNGNLVATKLAFESDIKTLKLLNEDLPSNITMIGKGAFSYDPSLVLNFAISSISKLSASSFDRFLYNISWLKLSHPYF